VLVELFTSEGCSSCPPADRVLQELSRRADVLPLAFHVTYWDRLGWPDRFGDPRYTERQQAYAGLLGAGTVYTPQMVVGGRLDVVGSDARRARAAIGLVREREGAAPVLFGEGGAELPPLGLERPAVLWMAAFDEHGRTAVERGENAGRTLDHHNVVRELLTLGTWDGAARALPLPVERLRREGRSGVAVVAQDPGTGRVVAIGRLGLRAGPDSSDPRQLRAEP
jgi:hypothetical protein